MWCVNLLFFVLFICLTNGKIAKNPIKPHEIPEIKIVGYHGPFSKELLSLFAQAEILEVIDCNITHTPSHLYSTLPNLKALYIENTHYDNIDHDNIFKGVKNLKELYYINGKSSEAKLESLKDLPTLKKLVIVHLDSNLKEIASKPLDGTKLEVFEFSDTGIEKIDDDAFHNQEELHLLNFSKNKIKNISKKTLTPLKKLKVLDLHENLIEKFTVEEIPELPELEVIDISGNPLKELNLDGIEKLAPKLKTLKIVGNSIPEAKLKEIVGKAKINVVTE